LPGTKPKQIQHTQSALVIDDIITPRVTSLGYSGDLASENIEELGNVNIVEILDDTPTISSTIDLNDYGSIETLAVLANMHDRPLYNNINGNLWDSTYWEIDATNFEEAAVDLLNPIKQASGNYHTSWFNNCQVQSYSATYSVDGFATESVSLENSSQYVFLKDLRYARVFVPQYRNWSDNAGAQFDGTTAYTITLNPDEAIAPLWAGANTAAGGDTTSWQFNDLGDTFAAGTGDVTGAYLTKNGVVQTRTHWNWDGTRIEVTETGDGQLYWAATDRLRLIGALSGIETFAGPTATGRAGLRKGNAKMYFWDAGSDTAYNNFGVGSDATSNFVLRMPAVGDTSYSKRIQSVSIDVTWNRDQLEQLGEHEPYDRGVESTEITATISAIGSDAELFAIASGHTVDSTGWADDEIDAMNLTEFQNATNLALRIDIFNTTDVTKHTAANRCKSILLTGGKVTSFGDTMDVPGRQTTDLTISFNGIRWMGDKFIGNRSAV